MPTIANVFDRASLLLLCRLLSGNPSKRAEAIAELSTGKVGAAVVTLAQKEDLSSALYEAVSAYSESLPRLQRVRLAVCHEANRRRNQLIRDAVAEIAAEAERYSIEVVALKGARWVLEDGVGFAAWRSMIDIDILVRVEDYGAMRPIMERLGYRSTRRERTFLGQSRFAGHYHMVALRRNREPFTIEVHRHVGFQPALLSTESLFEQSYAVAPGLRLPCLWHAALHAIIHWQIHHYGTQLGFHRVKDGLDIARFLGRPDVDWSALADHAARVGIIRKVDAALATVTQLFAVPLPDAFHVSADAQQYVAKALQTGETRLRRWRAKQRQRIERLWDDHRFVYRSNLRKAHPAVTRIGLWALRVRRLPFLISHLASIALLQILISIQHVFRWNQGPDP